MIVFLHKGWSAEVNTRHYWRMGLLFRRASLWIGLHYSGEHKRFCINLLPCVTIWIVAPDGDAP